MLCSVPSHPPLQSHLHNIVQQQSSRQAHSSPSPPRPPRTPATQHMPSSPASESPRATTPPRRASRRKARLPQQPAALVNASDAQDITDAGGSTDDDVLELLRSPPTHTPGMLHLSKAALDAAKKDVPKHLPRQKPVRRDGARGQDALASTPPDPRRRRKVVEGARSATEVGKVAVAPKSSADGSTGIGTDLPVSSDLHSGLHVQAEASNSMDLAALSQSLPASFFAEAQQGTKDAQVGDAPQRASPVYELPPNWQPSLQNEVTPSKNPKAGGRRASKAPMKAGGHQRRSSLDNVPVTGIAAAMQVVSKASTVSTTGSVPSPTRSAFSPSNFDNSIPFHTGFNVHRAPQTPLRAGRRSTAVTARDGKIELPLVQSEIPRMTSEQAEISDVVPGPASEHSPTTASALAQAPQVFYAGPTFHNSPAGSQLPKPDLDDF